MTGIPLAWGLTGLADGHLDLEDDGGEGGVERFEVVRELVEDRAELGGPVLRAEAGKVVIEAAERRDREAVVQLGLERSDLVARDERRELGLGRRGGRRGRGGGAGRSRADGLQKRARTYIESNGGRE